MYHIISAESTLLKQEWHVTLRKQLYEILHHVMFIQQLEKDYTVMIYVS